MLYLNGSFVGRYVTVGPQTDFYMADSYLRFGGEKNTLTVVLAYTDSASAIKTLSVQTYAEYCATRTRIEFAW